MPKKIQDCTKAHLISVTLPIHGDTYTVISHQSVIDYVFTELATAGFVINTEEYRATADGQIAQGIYKLNYNNDPELNMMFAWTNSYNKQVRFKCGVGAYINKTGTVMVCGDMGSWARKHTGTADTETIATIKEQIAGAQMYYDQLVSDKEQMKTVVLNKRRQAQMLGILFAEYQIITTEQASMIRNQMDRPSHVYDDSNSLWAFYNYVTIALQHSHPKTWMEDQRVLHYFMSSINNFAVAPTPVVVPVVIEAEVEFVDPNQTNLLNQIADMEADQMDEDIRYEADEKLVTYTDPVGNTFETIDFNNADPEDDDDELNIWSEQHIITREEEPFQIDENQEWTGENAKTMSIAVSPEERDLAERELILSDERDAEQNSNFDSLDFSISITEDDNEDEEDITSDFF